VLKRIFRDVHLRTENKNITQSIPQTEKYQKTNVYKLHFIYFGNIEQSPHLNSDVIPGNFKKPVSP
jgi:hypothetical protein